MSSKMDMGNASSSDNEEHETSSPPQKPPAGVLKFKCLHCSLSFASRKEYILHSEIHAPNTQNNPNNNYNYACKRTVSQREMAALHNNNTANLLPFAVAPAAMGPPPPGVVAPMNQPPCLNLTLAPPSKPLSLALTLGTDDALVPPPPGFPMRHLTPQHVRDADNTIYVKRPRNDHHAVHVVDDKMMDDGGASRGTGSGSSSGSSGGDSSGISGATSSGSIGGGTMKPFALFDLNLLPPEE